MEQNILQNIDKDGLIEIKSNKIEVEKQPLQIILAEKIVYKLYKKKNGIVMILIMIYISILLMNIGVVLK